MPTLYAENVPDDLYAALREQARSRRTSIAALVITLLEENVPTSAELGRRKALLRKALQAGRKKPAAGFRFPPAEQMQREDRDR
jgi:hypothetical protein